MSNHLPSPPDPSRPGEALHPAEREPSYMQTAYDLGPPEEQGLNVRRYVAAVLRYKWLALLLLVAGAAVGFGLTFLGQPLYQAHTTLWIESGEPSARGPIRPDQLLEASSWIELLNSNAVLVPVVREQRLFLRTETAADSGALASLALGDDVVPGSYRLVVDEAGRVFTLVDDAGTTVQRGRVGEAVGRDVGLEWTPPAGTLPAGRTIEFEILAPTAAAWQLRGGLDAGIDDNGNFMRVSLTGSDPHEVAATLNALSDRYVEVAADLKRAKLDATTAVLNEQLQNTQENLADAEAALEQFRVQTITLPSENNAAPVAAGLEITQDPVFSSFFGMRVEQQQIRRDRDAIQRALVRGSRSELAVGELEVIPSVQGSSEIRQALGELAAKRAELRELRNRYTDEYVPVRRLAEEIETLEGQTIPRLASQLLGTLAAREAEIDRRLESASGELREIPSRTIEEQRLARNRDGAEYLYTNLRNRYEESRLAAASSIPDVQVLDRATPSQTPMNGDGKGGIILMAMLGGLGLAVVGSILLDRFDPRLRYPEQVTGELGLNILGAVPHVGDAKDRLGGDNAAQVVEAFREVRLNVAHAHGTAGPVMVTVTSPGIGDGKSFVASNLALAFADQGYRTLLIDGDIRRGGLHRLFGCSRKPGLTDYLAGRASREDVVQKTAYPTLHLLGCGTRMKGGPELLSAPTMSNLLVELRSLYSVILIDSPPLGAGVDPFALGTVSGNLMLVLRNGNTNRELAEAKLDLLDRLPVRVLGAVLNDVPDRGIYRYYSYLSGYESQDEAFPEERGEVRQLQGA